MGKQINYWMDYDNFLLLARKAIDLGCTIAKEDFDSGKVIESNDISIIASFCEKLSNNCCYFHLPEAGDIKTHMVNEKERLESTGLANGKVLIEASYSFIVNESTGVCGNHRKKELRRARIYCITGYYNENGEWIPRPECLTKIYNSLARYVKKIAPYTEIVDVRTSMRDEDYGKEYEYRHKEYITKTCLDMRNDEGYRLC